MLLRQESRSWSETLGEWRRPHDLIDAVRHLPTLNRACELLDQGRAFAWEVDAADGRLLFIGPAVEAVLGYPLSDWYSRPDFGSAHVHPDDGPALMAAFQRDVLTARRGLEAEYRMFAADGRTVRLHTTIQFQPADGKHRPRVRGLTVDVTDLCRAVPTAPDRADDADTGFLPRDTFIRRLEADLAEAGASSETRAVVVLSLDGITDVRDHLGATFAMAVLRAAAERLAREAPSTAVAIGRTGYQEFSLIVRAGSTPRSFLEEARRLARALGRTYRVEEQDVAISHVVSGISLFPGQTSEALRLHQQALFAMRQARAREAEVVMFDPSAEQGIAGAHRLVSELPGAIDRGELRVHFQPLLAVADRRVTSAEALIRWEHPELGLLPPGRFIDLTETTGLIRLLTDWVIASVTHQVHRWRAAGIAVPVSVNLTARDLADDVLQEVVEASLHAWGVPGDLLKFEVTERTVMRDLALAGRNLERLRDLGASISLDDYGTGQTGYSYLLELPVSEVKVDQAFVRQMEQPQVRAVVDSIVSLSGRLGYATVAEGVETEAQLATVSEAGFTAAQGFLLARPLPEPAMTALLRAGCEGRPPGDAS